MRRMVRNVPPDAADEETHAPASPADSFAPPTKSRSRAFSPASFRLVEERVEERCRTGEWSTAKPIDFVAAYEREFRRVYGLAPTATAETRRRCAMLVARCLKDHFSGDVEQLAHFVAWAWSREEETRNWRRSQGREGSSFIVSWGYLFGGARLLDQYRVDLAWREEKARAHA